MKKSDLTQKKRVKEISLLFYRYRFLFLYIIFGFLSILVELVISKFFLYYNVSYFPAIFLSFIIGLFCAFFLNVRFNFHITPAKRKKALFYFIIISTLSFSIQLLLRKNIQGYGYDMDLSRFFIAGCFFLISYALHRKLSFKEYKKVGVAIYADGVEDIKFQTYLISYI